MARRLLALGLAALLVVACGGGARQAAAPAAPASTVDGMGGFVPIGGRLRLFAQCAGAGRPTVILEAGLGGTSFDWSAVQPRLGEVTRTCAYDRAGIGSSGRRP